MSRDFVWRDAGRTVVLRRGALAGAVDLLREHAVNDFALLTTSRALEGPDTPDGAAALADAATTVQTIPTGQVPQLAANLLASNSSSPHSNAVSLAERAQVRSSEGGEATLVALGGGRVVDVAKAVASVTGAEVAAIPTTMSGAEMTAIHRLPAGYEDQIAAMVRPRLVIADPDLITSQPEPQLRASSMNALAHGADTLYTPLSNPVSEWAALRGATAIATALDQSRSERDSSELALGSLLCAYAIDSASFGLHHVIAQTLVRLHNLPHAPTNATILPHSLTFLAAQAPDPYARLAEAISTTPDALAARIEDLAGNPPGLRALGADQAKLPESVDVMLHRPELGNLPRKPTPDELTRLLTDAW